MNPHTTIVPDWKWGTAEGSRALDRILDLRLSFREKLEWLEEAENLTIAMAAGRQRLKEKMEESEGNL
ncbi:MAG: hypothetical protein ABI600_00305 [Luteolibacter sp.]